MLRAFGGPEQLVLETVADPQPTYGEVVLRVVRVSINRSFDLLVRKGAYSRGAVLPLVLGADPSGIVTALGQGVTSVQVGDRVAVMSTIPCGECRECRRGAPEDCGFSRTIGVHRWGGRAEYVAVPASNVTRVPQQLDFGEATVIARHGAAAYNFLFKRGRLREGETVVIFGASGALGSFAVQVAKLVKANVIGVVGADDRAAFAIELGAQAAVNYRSGDLLDRVMALTDGRGAELVLESSGDPQLWPLALRCVAQAGRLVSCGAHGGGTVTLDLKRIYTGRLQIIGAAGVDLSDLDWALASGARGDLKARIDRIFPLEFVPAAHHYVEREWPLGKVLIAPQQTFASARARQ